MIKNIFGAIIGILGTWLWLAIGMVIVLVAFHSCGVAIAGNRCEDAGFEHAWEVPEYRKHTRCAVIHHDGKCSWGLERICKNCGAKGIAKIITWDIGDEEVVVIEDSTIKSQRFILKDEEEIELKLWQRKDLPNVVIE